MFCDKGKMFCAYIFYIRCYYIENYIRFKIYNETRSSGHEKGSSC